MSIRYVTPVPRKAATGRVAEVYEQSMADFGQAAFMMLSPAPELHAAAWSLLRESELVGEAPRTDKEVVTVAVSQANECRFCIDAHTMLIHATGAHRLAEDLLSGQPLAEPWYASLVAWAKSTRTPSTIRVAQERPFPAEIAAEFIGTALSTHFANRMFSALTDDQLIPGNLQRSHAVRRMGGLTQARAVRRELVAGESLAMLADVPSGPLPGWAAGTPIGTAFAALRGAAAMGAALLSEPGRDLVRGTVRDWDGARADDRWLDARLASVSPADRPATALALLAALSPHEITEARVSAWRAIGRRTDGDLVRLLGFGAMTAVDRVEEAISGPARTAAP